MGCLSVIKEESIAPERSRSTREIAIRLIDHSPLTQTTGKFLTNRLPSSMIRARTKLSSNPKNKKIKKKEKFVETFFIFHCTNSIVSIPSVYQRKRRRKRKEKRNPNSIIAQHATRWRLAAVQSGDCARRCCGTQTVCVASLTRGRAIVCGLVLPIRQRLSTPKAPLLLSLSSYLSILPHHVDVI